MNETEQKIVGWLRDMSNRVSRSDRGMAGYIAAKMWTQVADGIERGDHNIHAALMKIHMDVVFQAGPARPEPS